MVIALFYYPDWVVPGLVEYPTKHDHDDIYNHLVYEKAKMQHLMKSSN